MRPRRYMKESGIYILTLNKSLGNQIANKAYVSIVMTTKLILRTDGRKRKTTLIWVIGDAIVNKIPTKQHLHQIKYLKQYLTRFDLHHVRILLIETNSCGRQAISNQINPEKLDLQVKKNQFRPFTSWLRRQ